MRVGFLVPLALLALAGCGGGGRVDPLAYDRAQPLDVRKAGGGIVAGVTVEDVSFAGPDDRIPAYLVLPPGPGPHPAVVFLHGATASRESFLTEAISMAQHGAVALSLTSAFERSTDPRVLQNREPVSVDRQLFVRSVIDVRRGLDVLRARDDVDPQRLALVGFSRGTVWAALAGAVEDVEGIVLMGPPAEMSKRVLPAKDRGLVDDLDTIDWVGDDAPAEVLVQGGRFDETVKPAEVKAVFAAAREPKQLRWYPTDHFFDSKAVNDQLEFVRRVLGLS